METTMRMRPQNTPTEVPSVLLWGGRSQARIVAEMLRESHAGIVKVIFDASLDQLPFESAAQFANTVPALKRLIGSLTHYVVCIGAEHGYARVKTSDCLQRMGLKPITLIHEKSFVESSAEIGQACLIMPCAVVHKFSQIGSNTIINTHATIDHECSIGDGVHIMGSAAIAGKVEIENYVTVGTNATILPFLKIGEGSYIGAGAVVTKDLAPYSVVAGVPATYIRKNEPVFHEELLLQLLA